MIHSAGSFAVALRTLARLAPLALASAVLPGAAAHSLSLSTGTLEVHPAEIRLTLDIPGEDLLHTFRPASDAQDRVSGDAFGACVARYGDCLLRDVILRDAAGERLAGRVAGYQHDVGPGRPHDFDALRRVRIRYELRYAPAAPPGLLTLQQTMLTETLSHNSQLALAVLDAHGDTAVTIPLTNRGNVETLAMHWPADLSLARRPPGCAAQTGVPTRPHVVEACKQVQATVQVTDTEVRVAVATPLRLLETWRPMPRADRDFLTAAERGAARSMLEHFFAGHNPLRVDGRIVPPVSVEIDFIGPLDPPEGPHAAAPERQSAHTMRVLATLHYPAAAPPDAIWLHWDLFNSAVLSGHVELSVEGRETQHELTPYAPALRWSRR